MHMYISLYHRCCLLSAYASNSGQQENIDFKNTRLTESVRLIEGTCVPKAVKAQRRCQGDRKGAKCTYNGKNSAFWSLFSSPMTGSLHLSIMFDH